MLRKESNLALGGGGAGRDGDRERAGGRTGQHAPARDAGAREAGHVMPLARRAQQNGTFAGWSVTTSVQGGEPNLITLNMFYNDFESLDGPPPLAKTLGPEGVAEFLRKGAGLINQVEQSVLKRVPDLSY
jgi:hypothetical protein